ncbi:MAG: hypothetical protein JXA09_00095 [Anaerolineae bacterium]|nr:hypothetical protein [Anaerolineae bacterium]
MTVTSLYGYQPRLAPFAGKPVEEQVAILRGWGNTAIFGGYQDAAFVDAAHRAGMPVYAEYGCFTGRRWWDEVPESRPVTASGAMLEPDGWYCGVNPSVPAVRDALLAGLESLVVKHAIDGVWLDFIRWPCHWEVHDPVLPQTSFDAPTVARFARDTGIDIPYRDPSTAAQHIAQECAAQWARWRCDQITSWVGAARETVDRVRPGLVLGLFGVPWRLSDRGGAILDVIGQDYGALGAHIDVFSPMVYHRMCGYRPAWIGEVTAEVHRASGKPVWPIIQSVDEPDPLPADEYGVALEIALNHPASEGVLVFTLEGALAPDKLAVTRSRFAAP